jgi:hypothetical protein
MKKLLLLLLIPALMLACSKGEDPEPEQGYTSFVIKGITSNIFLDCKIGYFDEAGECKLLIDIGDLTEFEDSKEFIMPEFQETIYLFFEGYSRLEEPFMAKKNTKNIFFVAPDAKGIGIPEKTIYNWPH